MFGCSLYFSRILKFGSPSSGLSDSTFLIPSSSAFLLLRRMLFFVIQSHTCSSHEQFKYLSSCFPDFLRSLSLRGIEDWKPALGLDLFLIFQTIRMQTYQLIISFLLIGQWTTSLSLYGSFLSFGSLSEFCPWAGCTSLWQCLWA